MGEGLRDSAVSVIAAKGFDADPAAVVEPYDQHESELEKNGPFKTFRQIAPAAFRAALRKLGVDAAKGDVDALVDAIPGFAPFPDTLDTLATLKAGGFRIALISNTDDDLIAGNVAQLGGHIDNIVTAGQARPYKPSRLIFEHALSALGIGYDQMVHVCASPGLDHTAA